MKKGIRVLLLCLLVLALVACGKKGTDGDSAAMNENDNQKGQIATQTPESEPQVTQEPEQQEPETTEPEGEDVGIELAETYWTAYKYHIYEDTEEYPTEDGHWVDMILRQDKTAQIREVYDDIMLANEEQLKLTWEMGDDGKLLLYSAYSGELYWEGVVTENGIELDYYDGTLYLQQEQMPEGGNLYHPSQLLGTWMLVSGEVEGYEWEAMPGNYETMVFTYDWDPETEETKLFVDGESYDYEGFLSTAFYDDTMEVIPLPIYDGCGDDGWNVRFGDISPYDENGYPLEEEWYVTLIDNDTLLRQIYWSMDGAPFVAYQTFKRVLPISSVWEVESYEVENSDWNCVGYIDENGKEYDMVPGYSSYEMYLNENGVCTIYATDEVSQEYISQDTRWILGSNGLVLMLPEEEDGCWHAGFARVYSRGVGMNSMFCVDMYLYYEGGWIRMEQVTEASEMLCAVGFLGYMDGGYHDFTVYMDAYGLVDVYPFLAGVGEEDTVLTEGGEWYMVQAYDTDITITVYEAIMNEETYELEKGAQLLCVDDGSLMLIRGNVSDIVPNLILTITTDDGQVMDYSPCMSLMDGSLCTEAGIQDITPYELVQ